MGGSQLSNATEFKKHLSSLNKVKELYESENKCLFVHYACQNFNKDRMGISPRIYSIAISFEDEQTKLFSVFQASEILGVPIKEENLDLLEESMLEDFYAYAQMHKDKVWVHWSMANTNYGFPAIENRAKRYSINKALDFEMLDKLDLSVELKNIYGSEYIPRPRLSNIITLNGISELARLGGKEEAEAFNRGQYTKVHQSNLKKVSNLRSIFNKIANETLITVTIVKPRKPQHFYEKYNRRWWFFIIVNSIFAIFGAFVGYFISL